MGYRPRSSPRPKKKRSRTAYFRKRYADRRRRIIERLGGRCVVPSCPTPTELMEVDHVDRALKTFRFGSDLCRVSEARLEAELLNSQLLCQAHSRQKTSFENRGGYGPDWLAVITADREPGCDDDDESVVEHEVPY